MTNMNLYPWAHAILCCTSWPNSFGSCRENQLMGPIIAQISSAGKLTLVAYQQRYCGMHEAVRSEHFQDDVFGEVKLFGPTKSRWAEPKTFSKKRDCTRMIQ